jgi:hypothetical protein
MPTIFAEQIELLLKNDTSTCEKVGAEGHIRHWTDEQFTLFNQCFEILLPLETMLINSNLFDHLSRDMIFHNVKVVLLRAGQITLATSILKYKSTATVRVKSTYIITGWACKQLQVLNCSTSRCFSL